MVTGGRKEEPTAEEVARSRTAAGLLHGTLPAVHNEPTEAGDLCPVASQQPRSAGLFADSPCGNGDSIRWNFIEYGGLTMPKKLWSKERVVAELKQHRQDGPRMHPQLDAAARRHFW